MNGVIGNDDTEFTVRCDGRCTVVPVAEASLEDTDAPDAIAVALAGVAAAAAADAGEAAAAAGVATAATAAGFSSALVVRSGGKGWRFSSVSS